MCNGALLSVMTRKQFSETLRHLYNDEGYSHFWHDTWYGLTLWFLWWFCIVPAVALGLFILLFV